MRVARASPRPGARARGAGSAPPRVALWTPRQVLAWRRLLQATVLRRELERGRSSTSHAHFATAAARLANLAHLMGGPPYSVTAHAKDIYHRQARPAGSARSSATPSSSRPSARRTARTSPSVLDGRAPHRGRPELGRPAPAGLAERASRASPPRPLGRAAGREEGPRRPDRGVPAARGAGPRRPARDRRRRPVARAARGHARGRRGVEAAFRGALPQEEVLPLYRRAAVVCLPCVVVSSGDRDGLPTSLLEAMALGAPVVSTAVGGIGELVLHEETGLLVPERDPRRARRRARAAARGPELARGPRRAGARARGGAVLARAERDRAARAVRGVGA